MTTPVQRLALVLVVLQEQAKQRVMLLVLAHWHRMRWMVTLSLVGNMFRRRHAMYAVLQKALETPKPLPKSDEWWRDILPRMEDNLYRRHLRLSQNTLSWLVEQLYTKRERTGRLPNGRRPNGRPLMSPYKRVMCTLYRMAHKVTVVDVASRFGLSHGSVVSFTREVVKRIVERLGHWIAWPTPAQQRQNAQTSSVQHRFPWSIGALDSTHIPVLKPPHRDKDYYCYKGFHSIHLQAVCDLNLRFVNVFAGWPGSTHDARVFRNSMLYRALTTHPATTIVDNLCIVADSAYPLMPNVIVPYRWGVQLTPQQKAFNKALSATRSSIERAFGLLKLRWRRLKYELDTDITYGGEFCRAACILHNICIDRNEPALEEDDIDDPADPRLRPDIPFRAAEPDADDAVNRREQLLVELVRLFDL